MTYCKNEIKCSSTPKSLVTFVHKKRLLNTESIEAFSDPLTEMSTPSPGWASCPLDVLFLVYERLSPKDLMSCIRVNNWWRDAVDYMGQHCGTWPNLAQAGMEGGGLTFKRRSSLAWRDLYFNSRLWHHLASAKITWNYVISIQDIRHIHIYKDYLIVQLGDDLQMKCYKIDKDGITYKELTEEILLKLQEERSAIARGQGIQLWLNENNNDRDDEEINRMVMKIIKQGPFRRLIVANDNCFYILNEKNVLMCFKWLEAEKKWKDLVLARYYGCTRSIADIHIYEEDVYLMLKSGTVFRLDRKGRNFEPLSYLVTIEQYRLMQYMMLLSANKIELSIPNVCDLKIPPYTVGNGVLFHKFSAIVGVPSDKEFKINQDMNSVIMEYPDLSCATQHGDVLLLGFKDGKIEIGLAKNLTNGGKPEVREYIQHYHNYLDDNPEIVCIEVYEVKESHRVFVATRFHIYELIIRYPEHIREGLGMCKS